MATALKAKNHPVVFTRKFWEENERYFGFSETSHASVFFGSKNVTTACLICRQN